MSVPVSYFIETEFEARQWLEHFRRTRFENNGLGLDSETTGVHKTKSLPIIWSLSDSVSRICLDAKLLPIFKESLLEDPETDLDIANAKFDAHMFANAGVDISKAGEWRDTTMMSFLENENKLGRHGLKENIFDHFGRRRPTFTDVFGKIPPKKKNQERMTTGELIRIALANPVQREAATDYASLDAYDHTILRAHYDKILESILLYEGMTAKRFFYEVEVPFTKLLWRLERRGFTVDAGHFKEVAPSMVQTMTAIEKEFFKAAGKMINLNSTPQLREFFYGVLGKQVTKMTDGGDTGIKQPSTDAEVLEGWAGEGDQFANMLMEHRSVSKIYGTYVSGLMDHINAPISYRIHTSLNQHGAVTGRLSSNDPNLQNIPRAGEDAFKIREAFVASEGMTLVVADYGQLEMRLLAHFSQDQKMIDAILKDIDIHCLSVAELSGGRVTYAMVEAAKKAEKKFKNGTLGRDLTAEEEQLLIDRQNKKAAGFGIVYGIGGKLLAHNLTRDSKGKYLVTEQEGRELIEGWLDVFPGVRRHIEARKHQIWTVGYIQTLMGRFRRFGDLRGMSKMDRSLAERQGVNSEVQGSAADIAKMSMLRCESDPELNSLGARMLLQVHDELIWECPSDPKIVKRVRERAKEIMEHPFPRDLTVPLPVEVGSGWSWATAK